MGKIAHRVSIALGFAVACLHALCGAGKAEAKAYAASDDAFLARKSGLSAKATIRQKNLFCIARPTSIFGRILVFCAGAVTILMPVLK